jgi:hypothetical protein
MIKGKEDLKRRNVEEGFYDLTYKGAKVTGFTNAGNMKMIHYFTDEDECWFQTSTKYVVKVDDSGVPIYPATHVFFLKELEKHGTVKINEDVTVTNPDEVIAASELLVGSKVRVFVTQITQNGNQYNSILLGKLGKKGEQDYSYIMPATTENTDPEQQTVWEQEVYQTMQANSEFVNF